MLAVHPRRPKLGEWAGGSRGRSFYGAGRARLLSWPGELSRHPRMLLYPGRSTQRKVFKDQGSPPTGHQLPGR